MSKQGGEGVSRKERYLKPVGSLFWQNIARCKVLDNQIFFGDSMDHITDVHRSICGGCPVKKECLEFALRNNEHGIWAATNYADRKKIRRKRNAA